MSAGARLVVITKAPVDLSDGLALTYERHSRLYARYADRYETTFCARGPLATGRSPLARAADVVLLAQPPFTEGHAFLRKWPAVAGRVRRAIANAELVLARMPCFESVAATYFRRPGQLLIQWFGGELGEGPPVERVHFTRERRRIALRAMVASARRADVVLTQGSAMRDWLTSHGVRARSVVKGVLDEDDFIAPRPRFRDRTIRLLTVARLEHEKNPELLVDALGLLRREADDFRLDVVGEGTMRERLERRASSLGLGDAIAFAGDVDDRARLRELYRGADAFLLASRTEGVSSAAMEAMAAGLPTIVPDVGGMADVVRDGENGFLLRSPTAADIAQLVCTLAGDPARADKIGGQAARDARAFLWSQWIEEFAELAASARVRR